MTKLVHC